MSSVEDGTIVAQSHPAASISGLTVIYDAWNRMTAVYQAVPRTVGSETTYTAGALIARYEYDGAGNRIGKTVAIEEEQHPTTITGYNRTDYYYNATGQILEERTAANVPSPTGGGQGEGFSISWTAIMGGGLAGE